MTVATAARAKFSVRRSYSAALEDVWDLWTTKTGIEAWWGPEGFEVRVASLDLRPGGALDYVMTAVGEDQAAFMRQAGMPASTDCRVTYTEVSPMSRLSFKTLTDFVPGIEPYEVATVVELESSGGIVDVAITFDAMHDDVWTERTRAGHESQLRKLDAVVGLVDGDRA